MHMLTIGPTWAAQISNIRRNHTEDSNLVRWGNTFYRVCRELDTPFIVNLGTGAGADEANLRLQFKSRDFYVHQVGDTFFERYSYDLINDGNGAPTISLSRLANAVHSLSKGKDTANRFHQQSLVVFCVAESIRNDQFATRLGLVFAAASQGLRGVEPEEPLLPWWDLAHQWGATSDAIYAKLTPELSRVVKLPRAQLSEAERRLTAYVDPRELGGKLERCARTMAVLKRPRSR